MTHTVIPRLTFEKLLTPTANTPLVTILHSSPPQSAQSKEEIIIYYLW